MSAQPSEPGPQFYSRRAFLRRSGAGLVTVAALATAASTLVLNRRKGQGLPGAGSIFEPRREDLLRHWKLKLSRFRLR